MKTIKFLAVAALLALAGVAQANRYEEDIAAPSTLASQEEVVIGEGEVPAPTVESYGVMPSWVGGCCERQYSKADHLWNGYCAQKHGCGCNAGCCGKAFCGTGPFTKGCCCESKCGRTFTLPKLNLWDKCCDAATHCKAKVRRCTQKVKHCTQKIERPQLLEKCCQKSQHCCQKACQKTETVCQKAKGCVKNVKCRRPILSRLRLFRGCHHSKCGKGKGKAPGGEVYETNDLPAPTIEGGVIEGDQSDMPGEVPPVPPMADPAA